MLPVAIWGPWGLPFPAVIESGKRNQAIGGWGVIQRVLPTDPKGPIQTDGGTQVIVGVKLPIHPHRGPGYQGKATSLTGAVLRGDDSPEAQPGEGAEIPGTEVLFSYDRDGDVSE